MTIQIEPGDLILIIGAFLAFLISLVFAFRFNKNNRPANYFLISFLFTVFIGIFLKVLDKLDFVTSFPHLSKWNHPVGLLRTIFFYLYFFFITQPQRRVNFKTLIHFVPFLCVLIYLTPYYLLSAEEKVNVLEGLGSGTLGRMPEWYKWVAIAYSLTYFVLSTVQLRQFHASKAGIHQNFHKNLRSWLLLMLAGFAAFLLSSLIAFLSDVEILKFYPFYILSFLIIIVCGRLLIIPDLRDDEKASKYARSSLTEELKKKYLEMINRLMTEEQLYRKESLRLSDIAAIVKIPEYLVSQVINEMTSQSFSHFVNQFRIEAAIKMLKDPVYAHLTIEGIGLESGFSSRASFYKAFKKSTGITPLEYKNKV